VLADMQIFYAGCAPRPQCPVIDWPFPRVSQNLMSEQILLQGKILGIEPFLASGGATVTEELFAGRSQWLTLISEVLPRALLAELGLSRILLGTSGGGQFLVVLPGEARGAAEQFLSAAAQQMAELSAANLRLLWSVTENLGDWSVVRKRLNEEQLRKRSVPLAGVGSQAFQPFAPVADSASSEPDRYFSTELGLKIREASLIGWSPEAPAMVMPGSGKHTWAISSNLSLDGITLARHAAPTDDGTSAASCSVLAARAQGRPLWGVLRGDVDHFAVRMRRVQTIEEHVQLSVLYKQLFAGELEVLCSMPEFWRKVTILYSGGDDFAVYGSWDALILLARELQRLFHRFTEENLKDFPGAEAKTISMALAIAPEPDATLAAVFGQAGANLDLAKSADKDCIYLLGRVLEWKRLADASELKENIVQMLEEFRGARQFLGQLRGFYQKEIVVGASPDADAAISRLGRFQRRYHRALGSSRDREFQKLRAHLVNEIVGRKAVPQGKPGARVKLRPAGLVAMEWARLATEV
jgi:CRISPR-associated protein Csm1